MLDDVERRGFLVEPAREHPAPFLVGALDVELDEGASQFLFLPRGGRLAGAKADDDVLPPRRLAGVECDGLDDPVALVEDPEHRHALGHGGHSALPCSGRRRLAPGRRIALLLAAAARRERERESQRCSQCLHVYSGIQGS
jgi:hypothetical protein